MKRPWLIPLLLLVAVVIAYLPVLTRAGWIWDDDEYVTGNTLIRSADGLGPIWLQEHATPQYYPLVFTSFAAEYQLWGLHPAGYHLTNILLHAANACMLWLVLRRLGVPGAALAAGLFALHPVAVESVAWVTERKNVLSLFLALSSLLAYLWFAGSDPFHAAAPTRNTPAQRWRPWAWYAAALALFAMALFSKTVTCSLPAVVLVLVWWKQGWRPLWRHALYLLPFFALGLLLARVTSRYEVQYVGANGPDFALSLADRVLIAGRAVWFYAGKTLWPAPLAFIYERWQVDPSAWWQWLYPLGAAGTLVALAALARRLGRGPLVAAVLFIGMLFPALGFFNVFPMRYSFVADHFQYHASTVMIAALAAGLRLAGDRLIARTDWRADRAAIVGATGLLGILGVLTVRQGGIYVDQFTLWTDTIAKTPTASIAWNNLSAEVYHRDHRNLPLAMEHAQKAVVLAPRSWEARLSLANLLMGDAQQHAGTRSARETRARFDQARDEILQAQQVRPDHPAIYQALATYYGLIGQTDTSISFLRQALARYRVPAEAAGTHLVLGQVLLDRKGDLDGAREQFEQVLRIQPDDARANFALGRVYLAQGQIDWARQHVIKAAELDPDNPEFLFTAAQAETSPPRVLPYALRAVELTAYQQPRYVDLLAATYAQLGQRDAAIQALSHGMNACRQRHDEESARVLGTRLRSLTP